LKKPTRERTPAFNYLTPIRGGSGKPVRGRKALDGVSSGGIRPSECFSGDGDEMNDLPCTLYERGYMV